MLAKKFAVGFGIAIILPMLVHYGVSTFTPGPNWRDYHYQAGYYQRLQKATPEEKAKLQQEREKSDAEYRDTQKRFQRHLFSVAIPVGIATIFLGAINPVQAIGTGLMFGGIFTLVDGYCWYWSELQDLIRFLSLLAAFLVLIFVGYRKLAK
jgi:hypothetical protein